jgi:hypothetical protein
LNFANNSSKSEILKPFALVNCSSVIHFLTSSIGAGGQFKFAFAATDYESAEGPIKSVEVVIAPAIPTGLAVDAAGIVTFVDAPGAATYSIEYVITPNAGEASAPVVVTDVSGFVVPGTFVEGDVIDIRVLATNPGGSSDYSAEVSITIVA